MRIGEGKKEIKKEEETTGVKHNDFAHYNG